MWKLCVCVSMGWVCVCECVLCLSVCVCGMWVRFFIVPKILTWILKDVSGNRKELWNLKENLFGAMEILVGSMKQSVDL